MLKKILSIGLLSAFILGNSIFVRAEQSFTATVTAYTLAFSECGKLPSDKGYGITTSGRRAVEGTTIAMDRKYKFGTKVRIEGFKYIFTVQDRGGAIVGNRIDIYMNNRKVALKFGKQKLKVTILD
jgi:3D (Asp-Asp-Asp) domain-containing protein